MTLLDVLTVLASLGALAFGAAIYSKLDAISFDVSRIKRIMHASEEKGPIIDVDTKGMEDA